MDLLLIERVGGIAGFGGPHLKSRGEVSLSALSSGDRQVVEALFDNPQKLVEMHPEGADAFRYRITRQKSGRAETIEVPDSAVPDVIKDSVQDVLE